MPRQEAQRDSIALLSILVFVLAFGLGLFLFVFYAFGPSVLGPLDQPLRNGLWAAILIFLAFFVFFAAGGLIGGTLWIIVMSRFLPKQTMYKWLTYGPQLRPVLAFHLRLLDRVYGR